MPGMPKPPQAPVQNNPLKSQYDPLPWSDFYDTREMVDNKIPLYKAGTDGHLFFCLHGAGHSAQSFAAFAEKMKMDNIVYAFDFRGHGEHYTDNEVDLSEETLVNETLRVLTHVQETNPTKSINLCGHSMGGSIATKTAQRITNDMKDSVLYRALVSLFIIDVVEGTAMEALPFMEQIVKNRPYHFTDLQSVIKWGLQSGQVRDKRSARVSMPAQVREVIDAPTGLKKYVWRTDLMKSQQYWT